MKTTPWWWEAAPRPPVSGDSLPARADVAIVGGGYTGVAAALELARAGRLVAIVEANELGSGASTRNGGMIGSGHRVTLAGLAARYGVEVAEALLTEGQRALHHTTQLIQHENIDCHFQRCGRFRAAWSPAHFNAMQREAEVLRERFDASVEIVPKEAQASEIDTPLYHGGCLYLEHGGLHPGLFYNGLLQRAERAGARAFANAPVEAVHSEADGWHLHTPRGTVLAQDVIIATNGYTGPLSRGLMRRLVPVPSYMAATEELPSELLESLLPGGRMMVETRSRHCYYRRAPDANRILIGARAALHQISPQRAAPIMQRLLAGIFPRLATTRLTHVWKGNVGMTRVELPHLGVHQGLYYALGFSGSGVAMAPYLGFKIAHKMLSDAQGDTAFDLVDFDALPLYRGNPWFLRLMEWRLRIADMREGSV